MEHTDRLKRMLEDAAFGMVEKALLFRREAPQGMPLPGMALMVGKGLDAVALMLPPEAMEHRVDVLRQFAKDRGATAFALVYDGYVSEGCPVCNPTGSGTGCSACVNGRVNRRDAIVTVVRSVWGFSATRSIGYGYAPDGSFQLDPKDSLDVPPSSTTLDVYDAVFSESFGRPN